MTYQDYLAHHGILGMRWGKRNGPPYPLNESQMSSVERRKNEESEWASKVRENKRKEKEQVRKAKFREKEQVRKNKVAEKELVRQNKFNEKEARRQAIVQEKEAVRQTIAEEQEMIRENRVDEAELSKQNEAAMREANRQYKQGRRYVAKALIGAGVMAGAVIIGAKIYRSTKDKKAEKASVKEAAAAAKAEADHLRKIEKDNAKWEAGRRATEEYIFKHGILKLAGIKK